MYSKKITFFLIILLSFMLIFFILYKVIFYTPCLLDTGNRNFIEKTIDFFCFGWHFTKASVYSDYLKNKDKANEELGMTGWFRKKFIIRYFEADGDDLFSILEVYKKLNLYSILEKLYIQLIRKGTHDPSFLREAGETFITCKNWKMSVATISGLINSTPDDFLIYYYLGLCYLNLKKLSLAEQYFEKAAELKPDFADAYYHLGVIAEKERNLEKAKSLYEKSISLLPNHLESLKRLKKITKKFE